MYSLAPLLGPVLGPIAGAWYVSTHARSRGCLNVSLGSQIVRHGDGWYVYSFEDILHSDAVP